MEIELKKIKENLRFHHTDYNFGTTELHYMENSNTALLYLIHICRIEKLQMYHNMVTINDGQEDIIFKFESNLDAFVFMNKLLKIYDYYLSSNGMKDKSTGIPILNETETNNAAK
jgi:hypothetical protein